MQTAIEPTKNDLAEYDKLRDLSAVSPEVAVNQPLAELVQTTITAAAGDSPHTARSYQTGIGFFLAYLDERLGDKIKHEWRPLADPTQDGRKTVWEFRGKAGVLRAVYAGILDDYAVFRLAEGDSKGTQAIRLAAVKTLLAVALRDGVLTQEQATNMALKPYKKRQRRDVKPVGRRLEKAEVRKLRVIIELKAKTDTKAVRDRAIIDLMLFAGLRRSEAAALTPASFKQDQGRWWLVLTGKGRKTRKIKIHDTLYQSLVTWLELRGFVMGEGDEPIFCNLTKGGNPTGRSLNESVIGRIVAEYGAAAGLAPRKGENRLAPHDLRRTCARNARDNGAKTEKVQTLLGHSDIKTTMAYIGYDDGNGDSTAIDFVSYE